MVVAVAAAVALPAFAADRGALVIVGGGLGARNEAVHRAVLDARLPDLPLCVIPLASEVPEESAASAVADFERYGRAGAARAVDLASARPERASDGSVAEDLGRCGGFWFTGGDQSRIVDVLRPGGGRTPAFDAIDGVHRRGGVVAGSSAGAAMMSDPMIGGGDPADALLYPVSDSESGKGVWIRNGMGFLPDGLTDQHFLARGRMGRLLAALNARSGVPFALGVDEDTAVVVRGNRAEIVGGGSVVVVDMRRASRLLGGNGFRGARMWVLGDGDRLDLESGEAEPAADKVPVKRGTKKPLPPILPFKNDTLARFLGDLARYGPALALMPAGNFWLEIAADGGTRAVSRKGRGPHRMPSALFLGPVTLALTPAPGTVDTAR
jgi:cyanophycinase